MISNIKLRVDKSISTGTDNLMIEGDNALSLSFLNLCKNKKYDVIYIDPPYNTGKTTFIYNDKRGCSSAWTDFIKPRVSKSYNLLKNDGLFFMSIDENELFTAGQILDEVFGKNNRIAVFTKVISGGKNDSKYIRKNTEYLLLYGKTEKSVRNLNLSADKKSNRTLQQLNKWGDNDRREDRPNLFFPIYVDVENNRIETKRFKGAKKILPIKSNGEEGCWRWSKEKVESSKDQLVIKKRKNGEYGVFNYSNSSSKKTPLNTLIEGFGSGGGEEIKKIFGSAKAFSYAKNLEYMKWIINLHKNKKANVLDFFAGSGTTADAVISLNSEDNGQRNFTLCGNRENEKDKTQNIFKNIAYKRVRARLDELNLAETSIMYINCEVAKELNFESIYFLAWISYAIKNGYSYCSKNEELNEVKKDIMPTVFKDDKGKKMLLSDNPSYIRKKLPSVVKRKIHVLRSDDVLSNIMGDEFEQLDLDINTEYAA